MSSTLPIERDLLRFRHRLVAAKNAVLPVWICPRRRVRSAVAAQRGLEVEIGFAHSFLLFYPTILIVALLLAGFWAGVTATLLCALASLHFYSAALNSLIVSDETERVGLTLFVCVGIVMSWLAASLRERANRLQEFEKVVEGSGRDDRCSRPGLPLSDCQSRFPELSRDETRRLDRAPHPGDIEPRSIRNND